MPYLINNTKSTINFFFVIEFSESTRRIEDFNPKSIKNREIVGKLYNF